MMDAFTILPTFLEKMVDAIAMLPLMVLEEKTTAIDFLKDVVSNFEVDHDQVVQQTESSVAKESAFLERLRQSGCLTTPTKLERPKSVASSIEARESRQVEPFTYPELMHGVMEDSDFSVDKSINKACDMLTINLENQDQDALRLSYSPANADEKMDVTEKGGTMLNGIKVWLPKEYGEVLVNDDDFLEDEVSEEEKPDEKNDVKTVKEGTNGKSKKAENGNNKAGNAINNDVKVYTCSVCQKQYNKLRLLQNHELVHNKPYACSVCNVRYVRKKNLKDHERKHTGEKPYACPHCGDHMQTVRAMNRHIHKQCTMVHKSAPLTDNDDQFTASELLEENMTNRSDPLEKRSTSTSEEALEDQTLQGVVELSVKRDYICDDCHSSFPDKETFYRHTLCHKPQKYDCDVCPAKFFLKSSLEAHIQVHKRKQFL